jgi:predicted amidophosphoribosyltransferase
MPLSPATRVTARVAQSVSATPTTSSRICLMCLNKFESLGRQNRICPSCKSSSEYESASALPELHVPV